MAACGSNYVYGVRPGQGGTVMTEDTPVKRPTGQTVRNCGKWKYSEEIAYKDCTVMKDFPKQIKTGGSTDCISVPTVNYRNKTVNIPYTYPVKKSNCQPQVRMVNKKFRKDRSGKGGGLNGAEGEFGGMIPLPPRTLYVDIVYQDKEVNCKDMGSVEMKRGFVKHSYQEPYIKNQKRKFPCYVTKTVMEKRPVKQKCPIVKPTFKYVPDDGGMGGGYGGGMGGGAMSGGAAMGGAAMASSSMEMSGGGAVGQVGLGQAVGAAVGGGGLAMSGGGGAMQASSMQVSSGANMMGMPMEMPARVDAGIERLDKMAASGGSSWQAAGPAMVVSGSGGGAMSGGGLAMGGGGGGGGGGAFALSASRVGGAVGGVAMSGGGGGVAMSGGHSGGVAMSGGGGGGYGASSGGGGGNFMQEFRSLDTNNDGKLSFAEYAAARKGGM